VHTFGNVARPQHSDIVQLILACMWALGLSFPNLCTKFMFSCCFFVGPVFKGHVVTLSQLEWHMTIVNVWKLIGLLKIITSCFCTGVPHCIQFHINPEMLKYYKICQHLYCILDNKYLSSFLPDVLIVTVCMVFWTKYVTTTFINTDCVTQKFIIETEWHDFLLFETILTLRLLMSYIYIWSAYSWCY
jgi:hypothetical protein